ncbi:hypothetical protein C2E23DRAFT_829945 [Lenzites betulinus]|nr:hypothetical protein C2E23DRAFT_829945 [Lenzites betulinus]
MSRSSPRDAPAAVLDSALPVQHRGLLLAPTTHPRILAFPVHATPTQRQLTPACASSRPAVPRPLGRVCSPSPGRAQMPRAQSRELESVRVPAALNAPSTPGMRHRRPYLPRRPAPVRQYGAGDERIAAGRPPTQPWAISKRRCVSFLRDALCSGSGSARACWACQGRHVLGNTHAGMER